MKLHVTETIEIHESFGAKATRSGARKPFLEMLGGDDLHRATQTWRKRRRTIDRENDRYVEQVTDHEGVVVRDVDVPLSEHRGHGSDWTQPKAHP